MLAEERFSLIMEQLNRKRTVTVQELCEALNTSESTIRRDLTELDRLGTAAATGQIAYTGGAVEGCWSEAAYDGSGTLVTHDLVMEGMA